MEAPLVSADNSAASKSMADNPQTNRVFMISSNRLSHSGISETEEHLANHSPDFDSV
jgi:hypothetical protein